MDSFPRGAPHRTADNAEANTGEEHRIAESAFIDESFTPPS